MNNTITLDNRYWRVFLLALVAVLMVALYSLNFTHRCAVKNLPATTTMQWSADTSWTGGWR